MCWAHVSQPAPLECVCGSLCSSFFWGGPACKFATPLALSWRALRALFTVKAQETPYFFSGLPVRDRDVVSDPRCLKSPTRGSIDPKPSKVGGRVARSGSPSEAAFPRLLFLGSARFSQASKSVSLKSKSGAKSSRICAR